MTVVNDLGGNPEPLKLLGSLKDVLSLHLWSLWTPLLPLKSAKSIIAKQPSKWSCTDDSLLHTFDLIEVELAARSHEDEEDK